jgi:hypothetical protein
LLAAVLRQEAIKEMEQLKKTEPSEDDDAEVRRAWDEKQGFAFTKLFLAQRGMETGEDISGIQASWKDGKEENELAW